MQTKCNRGRVVYIYGPNLILILGLVFQNNTFMSVDIFRLPNPVKHFLHIELSKTNQNQLALLTLINWTNKTKAYSGICW